MTALAMAGLVEAVKKHNKQHGVYSKEVEAEPQPVPVEVHLQPDMLKVCDALRINNRTKTALEEYDATTLEDLAYMTNYDFEQMLATAARCNRPLCPLQQRKIAVLAWWVRDLVKGAAPFREESKKQEKPNFIERMMHTPSQWANRINLYNKEVDDAKSVETNTIIPPDWEVRFGQDLPVLKKKLKEVGETSSFSLYSDFFINVRWIFCGFQH